MTREEAEFVAELVFCRPNEMPHVTAAVARELMRLGKKHRRLAEAECNRELSEIEQNSCRRLRELIIELCRPRGWKVDMGGDPRGCTVKLGLPSGRTDSFGGDGWCVPGA